MSYSRLCDINKKKGNITNKAQGEHKLPGSKENSRVLHRKKKASLSSRVDPIHQDNKFRDLVEKLIQLEPNDLPKS